MLANPMDFVKHRKWARQQGLVLVQALASMLMSAWVITAAFAVFAWVQNNHQHLQSRADLQDRMLWALSMLQERAARAGASTVQWDSQERARLLSPVFAIQGTDNTLSLTHPRSLSTADCQGHQTTAGTWLQDDFKRSSKNELSCKDSLRSNTSYQALVDNITQVGFLYAQALSGPAQHMQWRSAASVTNWQAVRGVQVCLQTTLPNGHLPKPSQSCSKGQALGLDALAWRSVAFLRHQKP